jgi:chromosome segregation ATPase
MTKTVLSVRITKEVVHSFDQKIIEKFGTTRGHKPAVIEELMKTYVEDDHNQAILEDSNNQIKTLLQQLDNKQHECQQLQQELEHYKKMYTDIYKNLEKKEEELEDSQQRYDKRTNDLEKEKNKWSNRYAHQVEVFQKLSEEHNELQQKQEKYSRVFGAVTNMSWWKRLLGKYPEEMKELKAAPEDQENFTQQSMKE